MSACEKLNRASCALLVVDLQEKLLSAMPDTPQLLAANEKLLRSAAVLGLTILATEQYPAGLGPTHPSIRQLLPEAPVAKMRFSAFISPVEATLRQQRRSQVLLCGVETHVCVQQTALDLLAAGIQPWVIADAVQSRRGEDRQMALKRMRQAGALITTWESAIYELLGEAGTDEFKRILKIVK